MESVFRLMRKAANVLLSVVLVLSLVPASAFAGEGRAPSTDPDAAAIDATLPACEDTTLISISGNVDQAESENKETPGWTECGTCEWMIDGTGLLTVRPLPGTAYGELASWGVWTDVPWYSQRKSITAARIEPGVAAETCRYLFYGCSSLSTVYVSGLFAANEARSSDFMFAGCTSLVGGAGTAYSAAHTDAAYAHIDAGTNNPGYFTGRRPKGDGDVNSNGVLNVVDAQAAYEIATTDHCENRSDYADMCHRADVTRNGSVDAADAFAIQRAALRGWDTF